MVATRPRGPQLCLALSLIVYTEPASHHLWFWFYGQVTCLRSQHQKLGSPGWIQSSEPKAQTPFLAPSSPQSHSEGPSLCMTPGEPRPPCPWHPRGFLLEGRAAQRVGPQCPFRAEPQDSPAGVALI